MSGEARAIATWLGRSRGLAITARSTWASEGTIRRSAEEDVVVVPQSEARHGGQAATCRASVTVDGKPWPGTYALRAELLGTSASREKREVAVRMSQIATHDPSATILLRPWRTAQTKVPAHAVDSPRDGTETVALDIMEWAEDFTSAFEGMSSSSRIDRAVELAIPLFSGLDHIHRQHTFVHRDVHPSNVLVAERGHLVLVDWGIASAVTDGTSTMTTPMGKQGPYLAPETTNGQPIGSFTDAWAMGVLLCEMACGAPLVRDGAGHVHFPMSAEPLPAWLRRVISGLTTWDRTDRMTLVDAVQGLREHSGDAVIPQPSVGQGHSFVTETTAPQASSFAPTEAASDERLARAREHFKAGYDHGKEGRVDDALAAYARVIQICTGARDLALRQHLAMALNNVQWTHYQSAKHTEVIAAGARLMDNLADDSDLLVRRHVAIGLNSSGYSHRALGLPDRALSSWDDVVARFGNDSDPVLRRQVACALRDKALTLAGSDRRIDALATYSRLIESFERDPDPGVRRQVALALNNKRSCLYSLGHRSEALAACSRLVDAFEADDDAVVRQEVAIALHSKGLILEVARERDAALAAYRRLIDGFSDDAAPSVQSSVEWARGRLG